MKKILYLLVVIISTISLNAQQEVYSEFLDNAINAASKYDVEEYNINLNYFLTAIEKESITPENLPDEYFEKYLYCLFWSKIFSIDLTERLKKSLYEFAEYGSRQEIPIAMHILAQSYGSGDVIEKDETKYAHWLQKSADAGNPYAMMGLTNNYSQGLNGFELNVEKADFWDKKTLETLNNQLEEKENLFTQLGLLQYYYTHGDVENSILWGEKSATLGNAWAMSVVSYVYYYKYSTENQSPEYYEKAFFWAEKAAETGLPEGMFLYGTLLTEKNQLDDALTWFKKAAEKGEPTSMFNLGVMYMNGIGLSQDYVMAKEWYEKAAEKGNVEAMVNLGLLYEGGLGVEQNQKTANSWYKKACEAGFEDACNY